MHNLCIHPKKTIEFHLHLREQIGLLLIIIVAIKENVKQRRRPRKDIGSWSNPKWQYERFKILFLLKNWQFYGWCVYMFCHHSAESVGCITQIVSLEANGFNWIFKWLVVKPFCLSTNEINHTKLDDREQTVVNKYQQKAAAKQFFSRISMFSWDSGQWHPL